MSDLDRKYPMMPAGKLTISHAIQLLFVVLALFGPGPNVLAQQDRVFVGGISGYRWKDPGNWKPAQVPGNSSNVVIGETGSYQVKIETESAVNELVVEKGGGLLIGENASLTIFGSLQNENLVQLSSLSSYGKKLAVLRVANQAEFSGSGTVRMLESSNNQLLGLSADSTLRNGLGHMIAGSGQIGSDSLVLVNDGIVRADQKVPLRIHARKDVDFGVVNNQEFIASDGADLQLANGDFDNRNGIVIAEHGSTVSLRSGASIKGGRFQTFGSGKILIPHHHAPRLGSVTNEGMIFQASRGDLTNGNTDVILGENTVVIDGSGTWRMSNFFNNRVYGFSPDWTLVNDSGHQIAGSGQLGMNFMRMINKGILQADQKTPLRIDPSETSDFGLVNEHLMLASSGGELQLDAGRYDNQLGTIRAENRSNVVLRSGAEVHGGKLESEGTGKFIVPHGNKPHLQTITNNANVLQKNLPTDIEVTTDLIVHSDTVTVDGTGTWRMSDSIGNRILGKRPFWKLVNGKEHSFAGSGQIGAERLLLVNHGVVRADQKAPLTITPRNMEGFDVENHGMMVAADGGKLQLGRGDFDNSNGVIRANEGSQVSLLSGTAVFGGFFETEETGRIVIADGQQPYIASVTNNGSLLQNSQKSDDENFTDAIVKTESVVVDGTGVWQLSAFPNNRILGRKLEFTLTNGSKHTISGSGQLGSNYLQLVNKGLIDANQPQPLVIDPSNVSAGDVVNRNVIAATQGGKLHLQDGNFDNHGGTILADRRSTVFLFAEVCIFGGILKCGPGGKFVIPDGNEILLGSVVNDAHVYQESRSTEGADATSTLMKDSSVNLDGSGFWKMSNFFDNQIRSVAPDSILTNGPNHMICGSGQLGVDSLKLVNQGVVVANQPVPLRIDPDNEPDFGVVNNNLLVAERQGELQLIDGEFDNANGRVLARHKSTVTWLDGASIVGGSLVSEGSGRVLIPAGNRPLLNSIVNDAYVLQNGCQDRTPKNTDVVLHAPEVELSGTGTWRMGPCLSNRIYGFSPEWKLKNGPEHLIVGSGQLGANFMGFINDGVVMADSSIPLKIDPAECDGSDAINNNLFVACDGGELQLADGEFNNLNGEIRR